MDELQGTISISRPQGNGCDYISIRLTDKISGVHFCELRIKYTDFTLALTGQSYMPCDFQIFDFWNIGKKKESKIIVFKLPDDCRNNNKKAAIRELPNHVPEGWIGDTYFGSQDSFFYKDGRTWARTHIYRYVDK